MNQTLPVSTIERITTAFEIRGRQRRQGLPPLKQLRWREFKHRDGFHKLFVEHKDNGMLKAKTNWHDYCAKVKDHRAFVPVASNTLVQHQRTCLQILLKIWTKRERTN